MLKKKVNPKHIIRLCRTWPNEKHSGIGLHAFNYSKYINLPTTVFLKDFDNNNPPKSLKNVNFNKVVYKDFIFKAEKTSPIRFTLIALSKIIGEAVMLYNLIKKSIGNDDIKESIIHIHSSNFIFSGVLFSKMNRIPAILQLGGTDIIRMSKSPLHKIFLKNLRYFVCVSDQIALNVKLINKKASCLIVGNGVNTELFKPLNKDKNRYTSIGNLRWQKNYSLLVKAFSIFLKKHPNSYLNIYGDGPERKKLQVLIDNLGVSKNIILKGYLSQDELSTELGNTYIYLQSSISEGLPKALLEAVSCGCPIISTNAGDCKRISSNYGICVYSNDFNSYAEELLKLKDNQNLWDNYHKLCLKDANKFQWNHMMPKIINFYNSMYIE
tara:strand:- start:4694 stop:5839 length:1146 start_codon:yes stop_codon:yes gene_type:complete